MNALDLSQAASPKIAERVARGTLAVLALVKGEALFAGILEQSLALIAARKAKHGI